MKDFAATVGGLLVLGIVLIGLYVGGGFVGLWWLPYQQKMETAITRNSNGYITAQMEQLRQFRTDYESAPTDAQKLAIAQQMREIADRIPHDVQPDIRDFLATH